MDRQQQIEELQLAMHQTKERRLFERYQAVCLHLKGQTNVAIADIIQRNPITIGNYVKAYHKEGIQGLRLGYSTGKPSRLSPEQRATLHETIATKVPSDVGFPATSNWTLTIIVQWVESEWAISYSLRGMSKVLKRMGFSHTRPTYTLEKADPTKQQIFIDETFPALKKTLK